MPGRGRGVRQALDVGFGSLELLPLDVLLGEGQQDLAGGTSPKRQWPTELDEWAELVARLDGRDADPGVLVPDVEVDALPELVAEPAHRRFGDGSQVERLGGGLTPVEQARSERVAAILGRGARCRARPAR